jgi:hypothetical protein
MDVPKTPTTAAPPKEDTTMRVLRTHIVDAIVAIARIGLFWVPGGDENKGHALMAFHLVLAFGVLFTFFALPPRHPLRIVLAIFVSVVLAHQFFFRGCVMTRAEQKLTGRKETCVDPFLMLGGLPVTNENRYAITVSGTSIAVIAIVWTTICDYVFRGGALWA